MTSSAPPGHIALVKPDYGVTGGFERLLARLVAHLESAGHRVQPVTVPGAQTPRPIWGQPDAASRWFDHPDYFNYLGMVHDVRRLDLTDFDLVISTQPPSYLAPHDRILGLFYHQARTFYELSEPFLDAGFMSPELHRPACALVEQIDRAHLDGVRHWLAGSNVCAERLRTSWAGHAAASAPISVLEAPPLTDAPADPPAWSPNGPMVCVSRHEWPKRTELAVAAAHLLDGPSRIIGGGGRLGHVKRLHHALLAGEADPRDPGSNWLGAIPEEQPSLWHTVWQRGRAALPTTFAASDTADQASSVQVEGRVDDAARNQAYAEASVFVAPALDEDYGLTALEAMVWGRPVVVCADGGGLVETVEATGGGIVVDPTPAAIAEGVRRIQNDPDLAAELRARAADVRHAYTWERAGKQLLDAVNSTLTAPQ